MKTHYDTAPGLDPKPYYACAFGIGIIAAAVMTLMMWLARMAGISNLDIAMTLGTASVFTDDPTPGAWTQGLIIMLCMGGLFALGYAWVFEYWPHHRARAWLGALIGMVHAVIGGAMMWILMPLLHSDHPKDPLLANPGFMGASYGSATVAFFVSLHIIYGTIIGGWMHFAPVATSYLSALSARDDLSKAPLRPA
jgi:hypothetical protein